MSLDKKLAYDFSRLNIATNHEQFLQQSVWNFEKIPDEDKTRDMCLWCVKKAGQLLASVPDYLKDQEICDAAVRNACWAIRHVPLKFLTKELCMCAIKQNSGTIDLIPEEYQTNELKTFANKNPFKSYEVPDIRDMIYEYFF